MRFRWSIIALTLVISLYTLFKPPAGASWGASSLMANLKKNIKLGLDLQGGIFMQLEVDMDDAVAQYLEEQAGSIKGNLECDDDFKIASSLADTKTNTITLKNVTSTKFEDVRKEIRHLYDGLCSDEQEGQDRGQRGDRQCDPDPALGHHTTSKWLIQPSSANSD